MSEIRLRRCTHCTEHKPVSDFHKGRTNLCKPCRSVYDQARYKDKPAYFSNITDKARTRKREWKSNNYDPFKESARRKLKEAVAKGVIERRYSCEVCSASTKRIDGVSSVQAHHDDYTRPLDVRWLCPTCHTDWHRHNTTKVKEDEKG